MIMTLVQPLRWDRLRRPAQARRSRPSLFGDMDRGRRYHGEVIPAIRLCESPARRREEQGLSGPALQRRAVRLVPGGNLAAIMTFGAAEVSRIGRSPVRTVTGSMARPDEAAEMRRKVWRVVA